MSRREKTIVMPSGRDEGKTFVIREMDAFSCESWGREALSAVQRSALKSETGIMLMLSDSIREAFEQPVIAQIKPPEGMDKDHPILKQAQAEAEDEARLAQEEKRESAPMQLVASLGLQMFFHLPADQQEEILAPLLGCISYKEGDRVISLASDEGKKKIESAATLAYLRSEAFKLHTDFFMPVVPLLYQRIIAMQATISA